VVSAIVPTEIRRNPNTDPMLPDAEMEYEPINFIVKSEPWNNYDFKDGGNMRLRTIAQTILKSSKFNGFREPVYTVDHNLSFDIRPPKHLRRRF
jgi:hypothetical protein